MQCVLYGNCSKSQCTVYKESLLDNGIVHLHYFYKNQSNESFLIGDVATRWDSSKRLFSESDLMGSRMPKNMRG